MNPIRTGRMGIAAAACAVLACAAPAAAQPHGPTLLLGALDRMAANEAQVDDYSFVLAQGEVRTPVYIRREDGDYVARIPPTRLADVVSLALFWPGIRTPAQMAEAEHAVYVRPEVVDGRPAHVVSTELLMPGIEVDSALLITIDEETGQIVGIAVSTSLPEGYVEEVFGTGGRMMIAIDADGHRATRGLLLPGRVRVRMRLDVPNMSAAVRRQLLQRIEGVRMELQGSTDPRALEQLALMESQARLLSPDGMDVLLTVEEVRVNPGPPEWLGAPEQ